MGETVPQLLLEQSAPAPSLPPGPPISSNDCVMHYREGNAQGHPPSRVNMRVVVKWDNHVFCRTSRGCSRKHVVSEETRENTKDKKFSNITGNLLDQCITSCSE